MKRSGPGGSAQRIILCFLMLYVLLWAGSAVAQSAITGVGQLNAPGFTIGVSQGDVAELVIRKELPLATVKYFNDKFMGYVAVSQGKISAFAYDRRQMEMSIENGQKGVHLLEDTLDETMKIAVGISPVSKIPDLTAKVNRFIAELRADGTLDDMYNRWVVRADETMPDIPQPENPTIHLTVGTSGIVPPYSYYVGKNLNGYDIELAYRFAAWLGADVRFRVYDYGAIFTAAVAGEIDCIMANLEYTEERDNQLPFSDILFEAKIGLMVRGDAVPAAADEKGETSSPDGLNGSHAGVGTGPAEESVSFWDSIVSSFSKTFLRENRWELFLSGVTTTLLITVLSILFGTALGFAVFMLCRNGNVIANGVTRFSLWLVQGMPMVVLLMILYYIIFGSVAISGIFVAVIGFTLTFGAAVFGLFKLGVGAIDGGQYEAACALGYTNRRTFFRIILPQAIPHILPAYRGELVGLIKATAVVGYIAVQDLTKVGDIVRSRTYEAFFPLIAVTVIYFVLEGLLGHLVKKLQIHMNPKRRRPASILKGVKTQE